MTGDRDRDAAGRPRNARPRDATGRPLAKDAVGAEAEPDPEPTRADSALAAAERLLAEGRPFRAHEVLEAQWKAATGDADRALWRGLAQLAVGLTHADRGNDVGAQRLLRRGAQTLAPLAGERPYGVPVDALRAWASARADGDHRRPRPPLG